MNRLFSEINNCYNLKLNKAIVGYKKKYLGVLNKMTKLHLIRYYVIKQNFIHIYLKYWYNKPLFILKNYYFKSNFKYKKIKDLKANYTYNDKYNFYTTAYGILTLEEMVLKNSGGKLMVEIRLNCKNIL